MKNSGVENVPASQGLQLYSVTTELDVTEHTHLVLTCAGPAGEEKQIVSSKNCAGARGGRGASLSHLHS